MSTLEARCDRLRHAPRVIAGASAGILLAGALFAAMFVSHDHSRDFGLLLAIELVLLAVGHMVWVLQRKPNALRVPVHVRASDGELRLDDEKIAASEITAGVLHQKDDSLVVKLARRRGAAIELTVSSAEEGHALLEALGRDAAQAVVRFRAGSRLFAYGGVLFAVLAMLGPVLGIVAAMAHTGVPLFAFGLVALLGFAWPSRVDVGPDGIRHEWLWWNKFIPSKKIGAIDEAKFGRRTTGVQIVCGENDPHEIHVMGPAKDALERRIRDIAGQTPDADAPSVLARAGMPARDWIAALRALVHPATYRSAALDLEALWRVVESPSATREDRAAAAIAVARDDESRTRLRVAAGAIAEPKLRVAIEAAADDDADALEQALDDLREL